MKSLEKDLQEKKKNFAGFAELAKRVLLYLPNVLSDCKEKNGYLIYSSQSAGTTKYLRPINKELFTLQPDSFDDQVAMLNATFNRLRKRQIIVDKKEKFTIDKTLYTVAQSIGVGLDLLVHSNSARKHIGNRFEELVSSVFAEIGIPNKKVVLQIPYETDEGGKIYKCETDLVFSPYEQIRSTSSSLDEREVVVSIKTTSKDRMGKIFIDKMLIERFVDHEQKMIGVFLNDVQRKEADGISYTLVSGLFMVYSKFLTELDGIYYLDLPPNAKKAPYNQYMKPFSQLITKDIYRLLSS